MPIFVGEDDIMCVFAHRPVNVPVEMSSIPHATYRSRGKTWLVALVPPPPPTSDMYT